MMTPFINALSPALWSGGFVLAWTMAGLLLYGYLFDRAVFDGRGQVRAEIFDAVDGGIAATLGVLFALVTAGGFLNGGALENGGGKVPDNLSMIFGAIFGSLLFAGIIAIIGAGLVWRKLPCSELFGLRRVPLLGVLGRAGLLLPLALPLILIAGLLTRIVLSACGHADEGAQEIVRFLAAPGTGPARVVVALTAVVVAPIQEELIFRGYLYGVLRRFGGVPLGVVVNALLFAGIHLHAPSLGGLFVLAVCLTLAYEWTGSIFVPMAMHALFNTISVVSLFSGVDF